MDVRLHREDFLIKCLLKIKYHDIAKQLIAISVLWDYYEMTVRWLCVDYEMTVRCLWGNCDIANWWLNDVKSPEDEAFFIILQKS